MNTDSSGNSANTSGPKLGRIFHLLQPYLGKLFFATALMLVGSGIGLLAPMLAGKVVDSAVLQQNALHLNQTLSGLVGLFVIMGGVTYFQSYLLALIGTEFLKSLRAVLFEHLIRLSADFYQSRRVGELLSRLGADLAQVQWTLTSAIPSGIRAVLQLIGTLIFLFVLNVQLTITALVAVPPVILFSILFGRWFRKLATQQQDALAETVAVAEETLSGIRTVQSSGREHFEADKYKTKLENMLKIQLRNARVAGGFSGVLLFGSYTAFALVLWRGGHFLISGELTPGGLTSFLLYTGVVATYLSTLGGLYAEYQTFVGASARIFELIDTRPSIQDAPDALTLVNPKGQIAFHRVRFSYPSSNGRVALNEIDLEIKPGEVLGLVGPSGSGKSTLFSLLLRFYDPNSGTISIDHKDIKSIRLHELRQAIGFVPQDIFLFSGTVEENIAYGKPDATPEQIRGAAEAAGADEFIEQLPRKYQELVGQRGVMLSVGQRQRIAIARAFLRNPAILLLDEATSSLDPDSEEKIKQALSKLLHGRTTLVIAHRLATARQADRILVLEHGRVVGSGTHDYLYNCNGLYRRYWELQSLKSGNGSSEVDETASAGFSKRSLT